MCLLPVFLFQRNIMDSETLAVTSYDMRPVQDYLSHVFDLFPSNTDIVVPPDISSTIDMMMPDLKVPAETFSNESHMTDAAQGMQHQLKLHICQTCLKSCKSASNLAVHERCHSDQKNFACPSCPKRFKIRGDLKRHLRIHTGSRPFVCSFPGCEKKFTTTDIRKGHEMIHKNQRDFKCSFVGCDKCFTNKRNLVNHENIHSQTKPYSCKTCQKRFIEYSSWYKHSRVHRTPEDELERVHKCQFCQNSYKHWSILQKHIKGCHESEGEDASDLPLLEKPDQILNEIRIQICIPIDTELN